MPYESSTQSAALEAERVVAAGVGIDGVGEKEGMGEERQGEGKGKWAI